MSCKLVRKKLLSEKRLKLERQLLKKELTGVAGGGYGPSEARLASPGGPLTPKRRCRKA